MSLPIQIAPDAKLPDVADDDRPLAIPGQIYLAGPFFNEGERWLIEELRDALSGMGIAVFSPLHDVGRGDTGKVVPADIAGIHASGVMLAVLHNFDPGTIFEAGFARALDKPVVVLANTSGGEALKMLRGSGCKLRSDIASAVYAVAWELAASA
jgi:nucleoside 2-deoxyribosyltransferase